MDVKGWFMQIHSPLTLEAGCCCFLLFFPMIYWQELRDKDIRFEWQTEYQGYASLTGKSVVKSVRYGCGWNMRWWKELNVCETVRETQRRSRDSLTFSHKGTKEFVGQRFVLNQVSEDSESFDGTWEEVIGVFRTLLAVTITVEFNINNQTSLCNRNETNTRGVWCMRNDQLQKQQERRRERRASLTPAAKILLMKRRLLLSKICFTPDSSHSSHSSLFPSFWFLLLPLLLLSALTSAVYSFSSHTLLSSLHHQLHHQLHLHHQNKRCQERTQEDTRRRRSRSESLVTLLRYICKKFFLSSQFIRTSSLSLHAPSSPLFFSPSFPLSFSLSLSLFFFPSSSSSTCSSASWWCWDLLSVCLFFSFLFHSSLSFTSLSLFSNDHAKYRMNERRFTGEDASSNETLNEEDIRSYLHYYLFLCTLLLRIHSFSLSLSLFSWILVSYLHHQQHPPWNHPHDDTTDWLTESREGKKIFLHSFPPSSLLVSLLPLFPHKEFLSLSLPPSLSLYFIISCNVDDDDHHLSLYLLSFSFSLQLVFLIPVSFSYIRSSSFSLSPLHPFISNKKMYPKLPLSVIHGLVNKMNAASFIYKASFSHTVIFFILFSCIIKSCRRWCFIRRFPRKSTGAGITMSISLSPSLISIHRRNKVLSLKEKRDDDDDDEDAQTVMRWWRGKQKTGKINLYKTITNDDAVWINDCIMSWFLCFSRENQDSKVMKSLSSVSCSDSHLPTHCYRWQV